MAERDIGQEILDGLREIKAHKEGKVDLRKRAFQPPPPAKEIRAKLHIAQQHPEVFLELK
jgi:putative transcriptional regulator